MTLSPNHSHSQDGLPVNPPSYDDVRSAVSAPPAVSSLSSAESSRRPSALNLTSLRGDPVKKKNVPYRPSGHLQAQIDKLGEPLSTLSPLSSGTKTEYFDVLPSFQMFQSILKRNDFEFDEDNLGNPPLYTVTSSASDASLPIQSSNAEIDQILLNASNPDFNLDDSDEYDEDLEGQYLFSDTESEDGLQLRPARSQRHNEPGPRIGSSPLRGLSPVRSGGLGNLGGLGGLGGLGPSASGSGGGAHGGTNAPANIMTHESYGHSVLDNIYTLPHARSSPLTIEIFVTKDVPVPHQLNALETKLKEYCCGDVVNGYVIITNTLEKDVDFGLFTVSLQGTIKLINTSKNDRGVEVTHSIIQKKILNMYDLNASYNETAIPSSAGIEYEAFSRDQYDGCVMGLPDNRILKAREKYKKFITFKFPDMLLDTVCPHGVMRHTMAPPSFGIDTTAFFKRAGTIDINKALGYGCLASKGSPIRVRDYCFENVSVSYAIRAEFIDKQHTEDQSIPVFTEDINDPKNKSKYIISKSAEFFLRLLPNVKSQVDSFSRAHSLFGVETFDTVGIDGVLYGRLAKRETWHFIKRMNLTIEQEIQSALDKREFSGEEMKRKHVSSNQPFHHVSSKINLTVTPEIHDFLPEFKVREFERSRILFTHKPVKVCVKKKKLLMLAAEQVGEAILAVKVPTKLISYGSPRLIQKYNNGREESAAGSLAACSSRENLLSPISSNNVMELYNRNDDTVIKNVDLELWFKPTVDKSLLPEVSLVEFNVVAWTYKTDYPIPISFDHDFFYSRSDVSGAVIQHDDVENTKENLQQFKEVINLFIAFLRQTKTHISQNTFSYLKGLSKLGVKKDLLKEYFQTVPIQSSDPNVEDWKPQTFSNGQTLWNKKMSIPLITINKNNVTLPPSFQSCLVGRLYSLQVKVKFKGSDEHHNFTNIDVPVIIG